MNCTKYLCKTGFRLFFVFFFKKNDCFPFLQFQQVLLLVACLLTQLTFCVSALYMSSALYYCFVLFEREWGGGGCSFEGYTSELSRPTGLCTEPEIVSPTLSGLLYSLWKKKKRTDEKKKRRRRRRNEGRKKRIPG